MISELLLSNGIKVELIYRCKSLEPAEEEPAPSAAAAEANSEDKAPPDEECTPSGTVPDDVPLADAAAAAATAALKKAATVGELAGMAEAEAPSEGTSTHTPGVGGTPDTMAGS